MQVKTPEIMTGSALISALFIMTLVAIAATAMSTRLQLDIYRTHLALMSDKLYLASQGVTFWAMDALDSKHKQLTHIDKEGRVMRFPKKLQDIYPGIVLKGALYDLQARFNINNLQDKKFYIVFYRLLEQSLAKSSHAAERRTLFNALTYWISPYQPGRGQDQMVTYYLKQKPPYFPSYQPMQSISELRLIQGVTQDIYQKLVSNLTTLPVVVPININTAPDILLKTLGKGLTPTELEELHNAQGKDGITDLKDIAEFIQKLDIPTNQITIESTYFLCKAIAQSEDLTLTTYTVLKVHKDKEGLVSTQIVSESFQTL